jgi:hypothetical protein
VGATRKEEEEDRYQLFTQIRGLLKKYGDCVCEIEDIVLYERMDSPLQRRSFSTYICFTVPVSPYDISKPVI